MFKRTVIFVLILLAIIGGMAFFKYPQLQQGIANLSSNTPPTSSVVLTVTLIVNCHPRVSSVGTLTARECIEVSN